MRIQKIVLPVILLGVTLLMGLSSCKKCTVAETDTSTGIVIQNVIIYPKVGYLTDVVGNHVTGASLYADDFELSWDDGITKVAVDWNSYDILSNSMIVNCKASFVRDVVLDNINGYVLYNVAATTCTSCENERFVENFVLVPKVTSGYTVLSDFTINAQ